MLFILIYSLSLSCNTANIYRSKSNKIFKIDPYDPHPYNFLAATFKLYFTLVTFLMIIFLIMSMCAGDSSGEGIGELCGCCMESMDALADLDDMIFIDCNRLMHLSLSC